MVKYTPQFGRQLFAFFIQSKLSCQLHLSTLGNAGVACQLTGIEANNLAIVSNGDSLLLLGQDDLNVGGRRHEGVAIYNKVP